MTLMNKKKVQEGWQSPNKKKGKTKIVMGRWVNGIKL